MHSLQRSKAITTPPPFDSLDRTAIAKAASTLLLLFALLRAGPAVLAADYAFPKDAGVIDVKRDFGAKGDGETDDTAAIQKAIATSLSGDYRTPRLWTQANGRAESGYDALLSLRLPLLASREFRAFEGR